MSRSSRRKARQIVTSSEVVLHQPVPFDDSRDSADVPEAIPTPGRPSVEGLAAVPLLPRPPGVYLSKSKAGVWGRAAPMQGRRLDLRDPRRGVAVRFRFAPGRFLQAKLTPSIIRKAQYRGRDLLNVLAVPFSRRARVCLMRKAKREMIFVMRKQGRNGARTYKRTANSQWRC